MKWHYENLSNHLKLGAIRNGAQSLVSRLRKLANDTYQKLQSKLYPQPSTPEPLPPSVKAKRRASSLYSNPKALLKKRAASAKKAKAKRKK